MFCVVAKWQHSCHINNVVSSNYWLKPQCSYLLFGRLHGSCSNVWPPLHSVLSLSCCCLFTDQTSAVYLIQPPDWQYIFLWGDSVYACVMPASLFTFSFCHFYIFAMFSHEELRKETVFFLFPFKFSLSIKVGNATLPSQLLRNYTKNVHVSCILIKTKNTPALYSALMRLFM